MAQILEPTSELCYGLAECHILCWREAYRGLVPDHLLVAFDVNRRTEQWKRRLLTGSGHTYVAVENDVVVGFSSAGPVREPVPCDLALFALYIRKTHYGSGLADDLIAAAIDTSPCLLWVFDENPRAQAFYAKHGFERDGERKVEPFSGAIEVRMVRGRPDSVAG